MRRTLFVPGLVLALGSSAYFVILCLAWMNTKWGLLGFIVGIAAAPITVFVVPVWKGFSTGNWWMLLLALLAFLGNVVCSLSGVTLGQAWRRR
jgi:hypothetical protein